MPKIAGSQVLAKSGGSLGVAGLADPDIDGDGTDNGADLCAGTPPGELVNPANGCTVAQLYPCDGPRGTTVPWKNHGKSAAGQSTCGLDEEWLLE